MELVSSKDMEQMEECFFDFLENHMSDSEQEQ